MNYNEANVTTFSNIFMKHLQTFITSATLFIFPVIVGAQEITLEGVPIDQSIQSILQFINLVLIPFIVGIAFLFFVWGIFQYFIAGGANDDAKTKGKSLMIYATLGFVIIIVFWGLVNLLAEGTGLAGEQFNPQLLPTTPELK